MPDGFILTALSFLQKTFVDATRMDRERRHEQARLLNGIADSIDRLINASKTALDRIEQERGSPPDLTEEFRDMVRACSELDSYWRLAKPAQQTAKQLEPLFALTFIHPAVLIQAGAHLNSDGTVCINGDLFVDDDARDSAARQLLPFSKLLNEVHKSRVELTKIAAELRTTAVLVETDTLRRPLPRG
ncbi:MAG: hypothetical protein K5880_10490 [Hydrogenophaga sp.]|uniref:hypothetical protein n=1 Tax=Hydrogenophaga sp. TaxID=1904254 RepID=UPI0026126EA0|nr:hypothetical protein [Hydrogenophaga sp.]MCV0439051.1 hypothetical protein [Hydrogenophaga sp.]